MLKFVRLSVFLSVFAVSGLRPHTALAGSELLTLDTRPGVSQKVMVLEPDGKPTGVVVLYAGGIGTLQLGSFFGRPYIGDKDYSDNFLVRVRNKIVEKGFIVALPDVPSDRQRLTYAFRVNQEHTKDILAVVSHLNGRYGLPIWIVGTSASAFSVANGSIAAGNGIHGVIFTASVTRTTPKDAVYKDLPGGVVNMDLSAIKVPALVASHKEDGCELSPPADSERIAAKLTGAPKVEVAYFTGGDAPRSAPCDALSQHGFLGIEDQVVERMVTFIRAN